MCHKLFLFFTFFPLYISYGWQLVHSENNKNNKSPFIFFNNCISAQVIHYSLKPCLCNLTSEMLAIKACTCNNEKEKHFILLLNKMCMNLKKLICPCVCWGVRVTATPCSHPHRRRHSAHCAPESGRRRLRWGEGRLCREQCVAPCMQGRLRNQSTLLVYLSLLCQMPACWGADWRCPAHFLPTELVGLEEMCIPHSSS